MEPLSTISVMDEPLSDKIMNIILDNERELTYSQIKDTFRKVMHASRLEKEINDSESNLKFIDFDEAHHIVDQLEKNDRKRAQDIGKNLLSQK